MSEKVRLSLQVTDELNRLLEEMAEDAGTTKSDVLRQALALMKAARDGKKRERHLGFVSDPRKLETEIVGLL
jgi:predicted transcriptional regulator